MQVAAVDVGLNARRDSRAVSVSRREHFRPLQAFGADPAPAAHSHGLRLVGVGKPQLEPLRALHKGARVPAAGLQPQLTS